MRMSLGRKLGLGFGLVLALMVCSAGLTYWKISEMRGLQEAMTGVRIPSLIYSQDLTGQMSNSASRTREYILMADDAEVSAKSRDAVEAADKKISLDVQKLEELSQHFVLQANRDRVKTLAERKDESDRLEREIFRIRKPNNPASETWISGPSVRRTPSLASRLKSAVCT